MQRYFANDRKDNLFILNDSDLYHIRVVMRMKENEHVEVVYNEHVYLCCIHFVNNDVNIELVEELKIDLNREPYVVLIMPFLKETKMDLILQKATELGVNEILLTEFERSIVKIEEKKKESKLVRWSRIMKEASEQSMRINIPNISIVNKKEVLKLDGLKILCSTEEKQNNIKNVLKNHHNYAKILIVIGPEGGISPKEEEEYAEHGFIKTTLGNQILRVETVPLFVLSNIRYENME